MKMIYHSKYSDLAHLIDGPFDPPDLTAAFTPEDFENEYAQFKDKLETLLADIRTENQAPEGSISVGHYMAPSRGVGVLLKSPKLFTTSLIGRIKRLIDQFPQDYVVVLSGEHKVGEHFCICITKSDVIGGYAKQRIWLDVFGF